MYVSHQLSGFKVRLYALHLLWRKNYTKVHLLCALSEYKRVLIFALKNHWKKIQTFV